jgi:hypothetical protein
MIDTTQAASVTATWQPSAGATPTYRYRTWRTDQAAPSGWSTAYGTGQSTGALAITDGGYVYDIQVQAQTANGLTRGGTDPTVANSATTGACDLADPTGTSDAQCTSAFQSSPSLPARIGEVQQYSPGGSASQGTVPWAVKYFIAGTPLAGGSYSNYAVSLSGTSTSQTGVTGTTVAQAWHTSDVTGTTGTILKGGQSGFHFTIQARSTRTGVLNATTYSQAPIMGITSGLTDEWSGALGGGEADAPYNSGNYPSSYGLGFIRYTRTGDIWAQTDAQAPADPRDPNTPWDRGTWN